MVESDAFVKTEVTSTVHVNFAQSIKSLKKDPLDPQFRRPREKMLSSHPYTYISFAPSDFGPSDLGYGYELETNHFFFLGFLIHRRHCDHIKYKDII